MLFKLKDKAGTWTNEYELVLNTFRLEIRQFLTNQKSGEKFWNSTVFQ